MASKRIASCGREAAEEEIRGAKRPPAPAASGVVLTLTPGNPMRVVLLSILIFEVIVFVLAIPVMLLVSEVPTGLAFGFGGGAALLALVAAGLMRRPIGYLFGWLAQLVGVALGLLTTPMFFVGGMFGVLWLITFVLGKRLDNPTVAT
jgi:hypothetical protein